MPDLQEQRVVAHGKAQDICDYLNCSPATLNRRMKDNPERFVRIGRDQILLVIPDNLAKQIEQEAV